MAVNNQIAPYTDLSKETSIRQLFKNNKDIRYIPEYDIPNLRWLFDLLPYYLTLI